MGARELKTNEPGEPSAAKEPRKQRKSCRSAIEEETTDTVLMDETIWKELPDELLENVIARVPFVTSIRFRLVCHKWNSLPFLQRPAPQELPLIYAVLSHGGYEKSEALYDHLVKKWYYISRDPPYYHWGNPRGDSGGLVCYADERDASFRVGNHLTRTWKVFPWSTSLSETWGLAMLALVYNPSGAGGYKIVWLQRGGNYGVVDYSSSEEKTTIIEGRIPANFELPFPYQGLAIGGVVYFQCLKTKTDGLILSYDVVSGTWEQLLIAHPPNSRVVSLAEGRGRLLLVGWVDCNNDNADAAGMRPCVCVWELDTQIRSWIEVDRMPTSYCSNFEDDTVIDFFNVECLSTRRLLVMSLSVRLLKQRTTTLSIKEIVAYDVVSREWSKVPEYIPPGCSWPQDVWYGISFFPSLSASP